MRRIGFGPSALFLISGCLWGALACALFLGAIGPVVWGGILISPLIGLAVGHATRRAHRLPAVAQVFLALASLYAAAAVFGVGMGFWDLLARPELNRIPQAVVFQGVCIALWGVTFTGWLIVLWPAAFLNHRLLWRWERRSAVAGEISPPRTSP